MNIAQLLDRPIAFYPSLVEITGSIGAALMLSQALYWTKRTTDPDGWFYKTRDEWFSETCMKRTEQESARRRLKSLKFWHEQRRGVPAKMYFRVDVDSLLQVILGNDLPLTSAEEVITQSASALRSLSRTSYMRAVKAEIHAEHVEYAEVLKVRGMNCGICSTPITLPLGQKRGYLSFDHIVPLSGGGTHVFDNIQPAHAHCNLLKAGEIIELEPTLFQLALTKPTGRLQQSQQDGLLEPNRSVSPEPTILTTETTALITTDQINPPFSSPEFTDALKAFEDVQREMKRPALKPIRRKRLYAKLLKWGEAAAIQALNNAADGGWQGVHLPRNGHYETAKQTSASRQSGGDHGGSTYDPFKGQRVI